MNFFLAHTPYHIILSIAIAIDNKDKSEIFIFNDFDTRKLNKSLLLEVFESVYIVKGTRDCETNFSIKRIYDIIKMPLEIVKKVENNIDNIYIFNDYRYEVQITLCKLRKKGDFNTIYVEDGSSVYTLSKVNERISNYIIKKIISFFKYKKVDVLGTFYMIDKSIVLFKNLVREELKKKEVEEISKESFINAIDIVNKSDKLNLIDDMYNLFIILDHSESINDINKYSNIMKNIALKYSKKGYRIFIKYHPREKEFYFNIANNYNVINKDVSIESIFLSIKDVSENIIISNLSTSLISCRKVLEYVKIFTISRELGILNPLEQVYMKLNITYFNSKVEV